MKHGVLAVLLLVLVSIPGDASPPANYCPGPCDSCGEDGSCRRRWWADLDTYLIEAYPVQINRNAAGKLNYSQCQKYQDGTLSPSCENVAPAKITLREWCRRLMLLPVPPSARPGDEADLYDLFSSGGVCP